MECLQQESLKSTLNTVWENVFGQLTQSRRIGFAGEEWIMRKWDLLCMAWNPGRLRTRLIIFFSERWTDLKCMKIKFDKDWRKEILILFFSAGREDSHPLDGSGGNPVQEVLLSQRRLELRHRHVGSYVLWRAAILGDVQSGCELSLFQFIWRWFLTICIVTKQIYRMLDL